jgi:pimeloyl-ACP methyl ester carboxylesterase
MSSVSVLPTEKPVMVLVHGATANGRMWDPVRRILEARGYEVHAPDLPGHGIRRDEPFTLQAAVRTVQEAVAAVAPAPVVVAGDSLGGYVTMASAGSLPPGRLRGIVPSGCTLVFEGPALIPFKIKGFFHSLLVALVGERRLVGPRFIKQLGKMGVSEADAQALVEGGISLGVFADCVRALTHVDFPAKLAALRVPVLLVNGGKDKQMLRDRERYQAAVPKARHVIFPGEGHGVSLLRSAEFADLLDEFASKPV